MPIWPACERGSSPFARTSLAKTKFRTSENKPDPGSSQNVSLDPLCLLLMLSFKLVNRNRVQLTITTPLIPFRCQIWLFCCWIWNKHLLTILRNLQHNWFNRFFVLGIKWQAGRWKQKLFWRSWRFKTMMNGYCIIVSALENMYFENIKAINLMPKFTLNS